MNQVDIGPGTWRLNPTILHLNSYKTLLQQILDLFFSDLDDPQTDIEKWELLKHTIQLSAKDFSLHHHNTAKNDIRSMEKERQTLLTQLQGIPTDQNSTDNRQLQQHRLAQIESELDDYIDQQTHQLRLRSATRWHEKGERNNKYFYRAIKQRNIQQTMKSIKSQHTRQSITNTSDILKEARHFYIDLYSPTMVDHHAIGLSTRSNPS
jgi:hypothetical protein